MFSFSKKEEKKSSSTSIHSSSLQNLVAKAVGLIRRQGEDRNQFVYPEYDLEEIKTAIEADSYIKQAVTKYTYLIYKAGVKLDSENKEAIQYVKKRLKIISYATDKPFELLMQEIADDLYRFSNAFLVKSRQEWSIVSLKAEPIGGSTFQPVSGYFRIDPASVSIKRDENGVIKEYRQIVDGKEKIFKPENVVHMYFDRGPNDAFGMPRIAAALEDVKLLRKIEGNVISLIYRFSLPIYHWRVGATGVGQSGTQSEIDKLRMELERMADDGSIITNERVDVATIGAEGSAIDVTNYLNYFERRVFTALSVSDSQMGRGTTAGDADAMESRAHDVIKFVQRIISIFVENEIINELLLEGGFDPILSEDDAVNYIFNEIALDTRIKLENHEMLKYQSNLTTLEEARRAIGKKEEVDEERLYARLITDQSSANTIEKQTESSIQILQEQAKVDAAAAEKAAQTAEKIADKTAKAAAQQGAVQNGQNKNNGNGKVASNTPNNDIATRNRPTNQHGTTSVNVKEADDGELIAQKRLEKNKKDFQSVYNKFDLMRTDLVKHQNKGFDDFDEIIKISKDALLKEINALIENASHTGSTRCINDHKLKERYSIKALTMSEAKKHAREKVSTLLNDIQSLIKKGEDVQAVFSSLEYRLRFLMEYIIPKTYWYSYAQTARQLGTKKIYVQFGDSEDREEHEATIDTARVDFNEIPAYHSYCSCRLSLKKEGVTA